MADSPIAGPDGAARLPKQDIEVLRLAYERAVRGMAAGREWGRTAVTCVEFVEGQQWDAKDKKALEAEGRPAMTFNKISPLFRLVTGYQQQNRYDIKYLPGSDALSTQDIADSLNHTAKQITTANKLKWKESDVFRDGMATGRGFLDVRLDFTKNRLGEVAITDRDPFAIYPDPEAMSYEPEKWGHVIEARWMSLNEIRLMYGKAAEKEMSPYGLGGANMPVMPAYGSLEDDERPPTYFALSKFFDGFEGGIGIGTQQYGLVDFIDKTRKVIRVLDMQHYVLDKRKYFVNLETGDERVIPQEWDTKRIGAVLEWAASPVDTDGQPKDVYEVSIASKLERRVRWTTVAGDVILYDEWSPYRSFTVIPFFAYFRRGKTMGMVEDLLDPQREINKRRSAEIHIVGSSANPGWEFHEDALNVEEEENLRQNGSSPGFHLKWKGTTKPARIEPGAAPMAMERLEKAATADLNEISGINRDAMGQKDHVESGRAVEAKQRQAVIAIQCYVDNFARTRELMGEKILELIQDHYTEERIIRTQGDDGQDVTLVLNQKAAAGHIVNDVRVGTYMVAIDEVPMSATFLAGQFEEAMSMKKEGVPIPNDVIVDLSSIPRKREVKQRLAQMEQAPDPKVAEAQEKGKIDIMKAEIQAQAKVEAAALQAKFDHQLGEMELRLKALGGFFSPTPPAPNGPDITVNHNAPAGAHPGGAPAPGGQPPGPMHANPAPGGPPQHGVIPGGGAPPAGQGVAPELPAFGG